MAARDLPSKRNPHLGPIEDDTYREELINKRRLGQTELAVDPGQVGTSNATKPKNLGTFDYAHLRVPLPKDLKGSGIFHASRNHSTPEAYFLMRRSSDGYISATGMFKVAFPWASHAEELSEKEHLKSNHGAGREEIAGNIWVPPSQALELAEEYNMRDWIIVLLDPQTMPQGHHDPNKVIKSPPHFEIPSNEPEPMEEAEPEAEPAAVPEEEPEVEQEPEQKPTKATRNGLGTPPLLESKESRKRSLRSASPSKVPTTTPGRKIATPKRTKRGRPTAASLLEPTAEEEDTGSMRARRSRSTIEPSASVEPEAMEDTIRVSNVSTSMTTNGDETESLPHHNHPALDDTQAYLDQAHRAIQEANKLTASRAALGGRKRKMREVEAEDAAISALIRESDAPAAALAESAGEELAIRPAKKVRQTEIELRKEKIKARALTGVAASLAIGAIVPILMGTLFQAL